MTASISTLCSPPPKRLEDTQSGELVVRLERRLNAVSTLLEQEEIGSAFQNFGLALDTMMETPALFMENFSVCVELLNRLYYRKKCRTSFSGKADLWRL